MEDNNQFNNQQPQQPQEFTEPAYVAPVIPYKEKKSPAKWFIIGGAVLLAAAIVVVVFLLLNKKGGSTYEKAERAYFNSFSEQINNLTDGIENKHTELTFNINADALSGGASDDSVAALLKGFANFGITADTATNDKDMLSNITFLLGGEKLIDMNTWFSAESKNVIMQYPEISKYLLTFSAANSAASSSQFTDADMKVLENTLKSISDVYFDFVKKYPVTSNQSFVAGTNTYTGDLVTIDLSVNDLLDLLKQVSNKIINDNDLMILVSRFSNGAYTAEQIKATLKSVSDGGFDNLFAMMGEDALKKTALSMKVYIKGESVVYREINVPDVCTISLYAVDDGTNFDQGFTFTDSSNTNVIGITNNYTVNNDVYTGTAALRIVTAATNTDTNITLSYKDFALNENGINGTVTFKGTDLPEITANFATTANGDSKTITGALTVDGVEIASITGTESPSTLTYQPAPELTADNSVVFGTDGKPSGKYEEFTADLATYFQQLAQTNPIFQLLTQASLPVNQIPDFDSSDFDFGDFDSFTF